MAYLHTISMDVLLVGLVLSTAGLLGAYVGLTRFPDDPGNNFGSKWLGAISLPAWLLCCMGVSSGLAEQVATSTLAWLTVVLMNLLTQPLWLLICYAGMRKIALGLSDRVCIAWREVPEARLRNRQGRRALARFCVLQGMTILPFGFLGSLATAWPLLG